MFCLCLQVKNLVGHGMALETRRGSKAEGGFEHKTALEFDDLGSFENDRTNRVDKASRPVLLHC